MLQALKNTLKRAVKNPVFWFGVILLVCSFWRFSENFKQQIIRGDARGYYAYLPAFFTHEDPTYEQSTWAENYYRNNANKPDYLVKTADGEIHNKYFPGVALLQAPFYSVASVASFTFTRTADGYSRIYQLFFYLGHTFYALLGLILFYALLVKLFPQHRSLVQWTIPIIYIATPLFHYSVNTMSFSHSYSLFLFAAFALLIVKMRNEVGKWNFFWLGIVLGMIVLVRPSNLVIVLIIPFLLGNRETLSTFIKQLFENRATKFLFGTIGCFFILMDLFLIWKWETGEWFIGSYGSSEGFNFLHPQLMASLFSFRVGLFVHTPILLLSILGLVFLYRTQKFQVFWWSIYFIVNAFIVSSWWCWDYESNFGNRPYTEHLIFLLLPLFALLTQKKKWTYGIVALFFIVGFIRLYSYNTGRMTNQRFTAENYISSLAFWDDANFDRWNYTKSCVPYGSKINEFVLVDRSEEIEITSEMQFALPGQTVIPLPRTNERFYYRISLDKKVSALPFGDVKIIVDAKNKATGASYYTTFPLYNDRLEGKEDWAHLEFEGIIPDNLQQLDFVKIFLWNIGGEEFKVKNFKVVLEEYGG